MNLLELSELLLDEKKAEEYLLKVGILKIFTECSKCGSSRITKISRGRHRCNSCLSEWSNRAGSILHGQSLTASKLIGIIKLFSMDILASKTALELRINQTKVQRMFEVFREIIVGKEGVDINDSLLKKHSPTFTLSITDDIVSIGVADSSKTGRDIFIIKRTRVPNREAAFRFLHNKVNSKEIRQKLDNMPVKQNHFWRYANQRLQFFRGTKAKHLLQHLKEVEFKYNHRDKELFEILVAKIARF